MPQRLRDLIKQLKRFGVDYEKGHGKHPHRFRKPGYRVYPVVAHNGLKTEIPDIYIDQLCKQFDLDPNDLLRRKRKKK